ncbi:MAG TPA: hypothetical protein VGR37_20735 [Longimicrobiaceae bacterium]|nr:hypothetical protein [Longimicrobiaceae bacterium]
MRIRSRPLVALLALLLLVVTTAEGAWAAACSPEGGRSPSAAAAEAPSADPECPMGDAGTQPSHGSDDARPDAPACPLFAIGGAGSCMPVPLPARSVAWAELSARGTAPFPAAEAVPARLPTPPPFHPPKA